MWMQANNVYDSLVIHCLLILSFSGQFGICEDTQVLRTNVFQGVHVAMQYFTLYDIKARGFVRPFCFGYVSKDNVKLDRMLSTLIEEFNQVRFGISLILIWQRI